MALRSVDARVLACLIEKEITVPDSYPLTLNALRSACNQSSNRNPVTSYDDRTIDDALVALKAIGLVRFVHPSHGGRTLRYRHVADEQWDLGRGELGVLAMLILRGPETEATLRARAEKHLAEGGVSVEVALDTLMAREPDPFVERLDARPGERERRYAQLLVAPVEAAETVDEREETPAPTVDGSVEPVARRIEQVEATAALPESVVPGADREAPTDELADLVDALVDEVSELRRRLERLERLYDG